MKGKQSFGRKKNVEETDPFHSNASLRFMETVRKRDKEEREREKERERNG